MDETETPEGTTPEVPTGTESEVAAAQAAASQTGTENSVPETQPKTKEAVLAKVLSQLTPAQRARFASGEDLRSIVGAPPKGAETPAAPAATTTEEPETSTTEDAPATEETPEAPESPETPTTEKKVPDRFRLKDSEDQAIALIAKIANVSLREAAKRYEAMVKADPAATAPAAPATPEETAPEVPEEPQTPPEIVEIDAQAAALKDRITKLKAKRDKINAEDYDPAKVTEVNDEITDARVELSRLETRKEFVTRSHEERVTSDFARRAEVSRDTVYAKYPVLADADSMQRMAFDAMVQRMTQDPKQAHIFKSPRWPETAADLFAKKHDLKPQGKQASAPATTTGKATTTTGKPGTVPTPKPVVRQVPNAKLNTGADGSRPSASRPQLTAEQLRNPATLAQLGRDGRRALVAKL